MQLIKINDFALFLPIDSILRAVTDVPFRKRIMPKRR